MSPGSFLDDGDGRVPDTCTGLVCPQETADTSGGGTIGSEDGVAWQDALWYCDRLSLAGQVDWRLPSVRDLQGLVDHGRFDPAIDPVFRTVMDRDYWSSSTILWDRRLAWVVGSGGGVHGGSGDMDFHNRVRAVRGP